jgi:ubiquinol-cytochrome c reductase cytochrome c subunit
VRLGVRACAAAVAALLALAVPAALADSGPPRQGVVADAGHFGRGLVGAGASLYAGNCASCHGPAGRGVSSPTVGAGGVEGQGPSLRGVGALAADFYLRTGYMPLRDPHEQPSRSPVLFPEQDIRAMVAYVASLGTGPAIPHPQPQQGSVAVGQKLFVDHCAGCHQVLGVGGYVTGARVPPLEQATDRQIAEAVRVGPYLMPRFTKEQLSASQLNSLIAYIDYAKHPEDTGGWSLGHLGPWPEGLVSWLVAAAALVALCIVLGKRLPSA